MSVVTIVWSMIAGACCTLAAAHLPVWWRNRESGASFAFAMAAICTAGLSFCELAMLHAPTPAAYAAALRWAHLTVTLLLLCAGRVHLSVPSRRPAVAGPERPRAAPDLDAVQLHERREPQLPPPRGPAEHEVSGRAGVRPLGRPQPLDADESARHVAARRLRRRRDRHRMAARRTRDDARRGPQHLVLPARGRGPVHPGVLGRRRIPDDDQPVRTGTHRRDGLCVEPRSGARQADGARVARKRTGGRADGRCRESRDLDAGHRARRDLGERQVAGVVRFHAQREAEHRACAAAHPPGRS